MRNDAQMLKASLLRDNYWSQLLEPYQFKRRFPYSCPPLEVFKFAVFG